MKQVLIVDDSAAVRLLVRSSLSGSEFAVLEASDGVEACKAIQENPGLDLVFLDVNMPRMNGLQVLQMARATGRLDTMSVVILTTESEPGMIEKAKRNGARGWVVKPFKSDALVKAARAAVSRPGA
jgi:two-component system, chemotaxis family, chemotaxis protein CheY